MQAALAYRITCHSLQSGRIAKMRSFVRGVGCFIVLKGHDRAWSTFSDNCKQPYCRRLPAAQSLAGVSCRWPPKGRCACRRRAWTHPVTGRHSTVSRPEAKPQGVGWQGHAQRRSCPSHPLSVRPPGHPWVAVEGIGWG